MLLLALSVVIGLLGTVFRIWKRIERPTEEPIFRRIEERDTTFRPLTVTPRSVTPPSAARPPCWVCGRPKDGHRHE